MTEQHVPIDDLAAYAAGDLDAAAAVTVEAHVLLCAECRYDVEAVKAASAALASVPTAPMPSNVAAMLDEALAAERSPNRAPAGTVLPMMRRRPTMAGMAAVAAGFALVLGIAIPAVTGGDGPKDGGAGTVALQEQNARDTAAGGTRRLASGLDYSSGPLATTLDRALSGINPDRAEQSLDVGGAAPTAGAPAQPGEPPTAVAGGTTYSRTTSLRTDAARLAACFAEVGKEQPPNGRVPLVVDFARYRGRDVLVLVYPSFTSKDELRADRVDVFVVGGGCGVEAGGDVLEFQRIPKPRL